MFLKKYGIHIALLLSFAVLIIMPKINSIPDENHEKEARVAATAFLVLIDADEYDQSWQSSAPVLHEKVPQEAWAEKLSAFRMVLGKPVSREETSATKSNGPEEGPEGEYIVLTYKTQFDRRKQIAKETITVMLTDNLRWKVAGYFVK